MVISIAQDSQKYLPASAQDKMFQVGLPQTTDHLGKYQKLVVTLEIISRD